MLVQYSFTQVKVLKAFKNAGTEELISCGWLYFIENWTLGKKLFIS